MKKIQLLFLLSVSSFSMAQTPAACEENLFGVTYSLSEIGCGTDESGTININVFGGQLPYAVEWEIAGEKVTVPLETDGSYTFTVDGLDVDSMTTNHELLKVIDARGCEFPVEVDPGIVCFETNVQHASCQEEQNGSIKLDLPSPQQPLQYCEESDTLFIETACSEVITSAGVYEGSGKYCVSNFEGSHLVLKNGVLIVKGISTVNSLTLEGDANLIIESGAKLIVQNLALRRECSFSNFGTCEINSMSIEGVIENYGNLTCLNDLNLNSPESNIENYGELVCYASLNINTSLINHASLVVENNCTINGEGFLENNCTLMAGKVLVNNVLVNKGSLTSKEMSLNGTSAVWVEDIIVSSRIDVLGTEGNCAIIHIESQTTILPTAVIHEAVSFCDEDGIENNDGKVVLDESCETCTQGEYLVEWSNGQTGYEIENLSPGEYIATITDPQGNVSERTFVIAGGDVLCSTVSFPNPCSDFYNIIYDVYEDDTDVEILIYDLWGNNVNGMSSESRATGTHREVWDGTDYAGAQVPDGLYLYMVVLNGDASDYQKGKVFFQPQ